MSQSHFSLQPESVWKLPGPRVSRKLVCKCTRFRYEHTQPPMALRDVWPGYIGAGIKAVLGSSLLDCSGLRFSGQEGLSAFWMPGGRICTWLVPRKDSHYCLQILIS